jgi:serralysin
MCELCGDLAAIHESEGAGSSSQSAAASKPVGTAAQLADFLITDYWGGSGHHWGSPTISYNLGNLNSTERAIAVAALNTYA